MKAVAIATLLLSSASAFNLGDGISRIFGNLPIAVIGEEKPGSLSLGEEKRLLQLGESSFQWVTESELFALKREGKTFFDVTDHKQFYDDYRAVQAASKFPDEPTQEGLVHKLAKSLDKNNMYHNLVNLTSFKTRYARSESGLESSLWLHEQVQHIASGRDDINVTLVDHKWLQKSLIASIKGTKNPDKVVVVGAHQDSINLLLPALLPAPGADDDGSGTVTILEVFRNLVESGFQPENTVEFMWYSAEELGLLGSQDIFNDYARRSVDVKAMLQQDMTGYNQGTLDSGEPDSVGVITDYVNTALTKFIMMIVDTYCDITYVETKCGYACSDHASASKVGYASAFVIESEFSKSDHSIHTTQDTIDKLSFDHMLQHAKLTNGFVVELANADL
jgi:leucyl aminopeptidase